MLEQIAAFVMVFGSSLLFLYWFRYTCRLVLIAKPTRDYAAIAASANQLSFNGVQTKLRERSDANLDKLRGLLDHDYQVLTYLLTHVSTLPTGIEAFEKRMLQIDYRLLRVWFCVSWCFSRVAARQALDEMSRIVAHFASAMGERVAGVVPL